MRSCGSVYFGSEAIHLQRGIIAAAVMTINKVWDIFIILTYFRQFSLFYIYTGSAPLIQGAEVRNDDKTVYLLSSIQTLRISGRYRSV